MYLAVEWTSMALHAYRMDDSGGVMDEKSSAAGVNKVKDGAFEVALRSALGGWLAEAEAILLSGMITSRSGWAETPYAPTPAGPAEIAALAVHRQIEGLPPLVFLPGVAQSNPLPDVMRGEETAVLGSGISDGIVVLPGAHSKWVLLKDGAIANVTTYLTGEMSRLLLKDSIVARLVRRETEDDPQSFDRGIIASQRPPAALFSARSLALFDQLNPAHIPSYLDGVLIPNCARRYRKASFRRCPIDIRWMGKMAG